jgi:uncharacterized protein YndB with AHSA1/START domain
LVESDPRPGGTLKIVMRGPDGVEHPMTGVYKEVVSPERLVVETAAIGPDGGHLLEAVQTILFADRGGKTEVTLRARATALVPDAVPMLGGMQAGWNQSLQCLDDMLTGADGRQIVITRLFQAPRERVFELWTQQEHVEKWWGPTGFSLTVAEMDVRVGGKWLFTMHGPDGVDYPNVIVYDEITPPERLVFTHGSPEDEDAAFLATVTFDDMMGMTALTMRSVFETAEARDAVVANYNAIEGGNQTLDRLGDVLEAMAATP